MTYSQAIDIARILATAQTKAAKLLREQCEKTGRIPTFVIMRYGDPRKWRRLPKVKDRRTRNKSYQEPRAVRLQNIDTGQISRAKSIVDFCGKYLPDGIKSDRYHVTPVLDGSRPSFKRWFLPETLARKVELRDVYGNFYSMTIRDAVKKHGLTPGNVLSLLSGKKRATMRNRLVLASTEIDAKMAIKSTRVTEVTIQKGAKKIKGKSVKDVAKEAKVSPANIYSMGYGFLDQTKGYKIVDLKIKHKKVLIEA